jgi:TPR repeat protein
MDNLARKWESEIRSDDSALPFILELQTLAQNLLRTLDASGVAIAHQEQEEDKGALTCIVSVGRAAPPVGARLDPNSGISGRCVRECRTQKSYDTRLDPRVEGSVCERLGIRSLAAAPLLVGERCIGLIEAFSAWPGHFDAEKIAALEQAAQSAALLLTAQRNAYQRTAQQNSPELVTGAFQLPVTPLEQVQSETAAKKDPDSSVEIPENSATTTEPSHDQEASISHDSTHEERRYRPHLWALGALAAAIAFLAIVALIGTGGRLRARTSHVNSWAAAAPKIAPTQLPPSNAQVSPQLAGSEANAPQSSTGAEADQPSDDFLLLAQRAKDGDTVAQADLAQAYLTGDEVAPDSAKAASWYIMAGQNGNLEAKRKAVDVTRGLTPFQIGAIRFNVGKMYELGIGSRQDFISAYMWFELARASGDIRASAEEIPLQKKMKSVQVEEARHRASSWLQSHAKGRNR